MTTAEPATVTLRPFEEADYPAYVAIANECYPDYAWTVEEVRHMDADWRPDGYFERRRIAESGGVAVGYSNAANARGQFVPENYRLEVLVRPAARRRGIGLQLFDDAVASLRERRAHWVRLEGRDSDPATLAFAKRVGLAELRRDWESRLDVPSFDPSAFASATKRVIDGGFRITSLADEMQVDPEAVRKAYRLHQEARLDVPQLDPPTASPYERFEEEVLRSPSALPEAFFIAIRDGRYVGESAMGKEGTDPGVIYQRLTGVLRDERGKGIAMALKLRTIDYAKAAGFREIRTWNASLNRPMLSINEALGFVKQPAWITFGKDLSTS